MLLVGKASAQNANTSDSSLRVTGIVVESGPDFPLAMSKVSAFTPDGKAAGKAITLEDGYFTLFLPQGKYVVLIERIGYRSSKFTITVAESDIHLGEIVLEVGEELEASSIESSSLISRQGTRITYDVSHDPDAARINMSEMATRIPELRMGARGGRLEFELKPISKILIDDEESGLINARRQYPMEFIKANHMKTMEIVLPGDPEFNNSEPILLITLAKKLPYGFAGQIQTTSNTKNSHSPAIDAVANTPIIGVGAANKHNFNANVFRSSSDGRFNAKASLTGSFSDATGIGESGTEITDLDGNLIESSHTLTTRHTTSPFRLNGALSMSGEFGKNRTKSLTHKRKNKWQAAYSYSETQTQTITDYSSVGPDASNDGRKEHRATASLTMREFELKPFNASWDLQGGYYNRHYYNNSTNASESSGLDYRQQVCFLDSKLFGKALNNKLSLSLLIKGEYVLNRGSFIANGQSFPLDWQEFNILPAVNAGWSFKRSSIGVRYARMVNRPSINQLNPYTDHSNPYYLITGNPQLKGAITNSVSLMYGVMPATLKWIHSFGSGITWSGSNNSISRIVDTDDNGVAISSYANIGRSNSLSLNITAILMPTKKLSINIAALYSRTWVVLPSGMTNTYDTPNISTGIRWDAKWLSLSGLLALRPSINSAQSAKLIIEPLGEVSASHYFKKAHIGLSAYVSDVFHSGGKRESIIVNSNFTQYNFNERRGRTFGIHFYWRFGRFQEVKNVEINAYDM